MIAEGSKIGHDEIKALATEAGISEEEQDSVIKADEFNFGAYLLIREKILEKWLKTEVFSLESQVEFY